MSVRYRRWLIGALSVVLIAGLAAPAAQAQQLKKVRIAVGTTNLNVGYPWLTLPVDLGYWKKMGYDVEILPIGASLQAMQQMVAGNVDFAQINSSVVIQAATVNDIPVRVVMDNGVLDWSISVLADGPIKTVQDLKGKTVGVFSLATGGVFFMKSYLRASGMDPEHDVALVPVGLGAPPVEALKTNKVQGLLYWASAQATFVNAGLNLRYLYGPDWRTYPDFTLSTLQKTITADPKMVEDIARGAAMGSEFAFANPDCARQLHWKYWPTTKTSGSDDAATLVKWDMNNQQAQLDSMRDAHAMNGGKLWGRATPEAYGRIQRFMLDAKLITKEIPPEQYMIGIPSFYEKINDFDKKAVDAEAASCPVK